MTAATDWSGLTVAGAFALGMLVGCVLTVRLFRVVAATVKRERE